MDDMRWVRRGHRRHKRIAVQGISHDGRCPQSLERLSLAGDLVNAVT
jgi:hypothetical protein